MITITIRVDPPLQCCTLLARMRRCEQLATVAQATLQRDGSYHVQPFCKDCTAALVKVYQVEPGEQNRKKNQ